MKVLADWVDYNANSQGARVGDCVKRSLSLAFGEDYQDVARELNRIKKEKHAPSYNSDPVWREYLKRRGVSMTTYSDMFRADTLCELKQDLEDYRARFARFNYEY